MGKKLTNKLNVQLNSISLNEDDPTLLNCKFTILDFELSGNNVIVGKEEGIELGKTIKGKPIRALYKNDDDFGDHEAEISTDRNGNEYMKRNTIPIGVFTSDGYIEEVEINGEMKEVLVADAHLWYSQFKESIQLLMEWFDEGLDIQMSCEYLYSNYEFKDGIEYHRSPLLFEAHTILGKNVAPSYKSAKLLQFNQLEEFSLAVAQALNNKEVNELEDVKNEEQLNTEESTEEELDIETKIEEESENESTDTDVKSDEKEVEETKSQLNAKSLYALSEDIRNQVRANGTDEEWFWVSDLYLDHAIVAIETSDDYKHYKFNYTVENDVVTVDLSSKVEVKEKREWVTVTNELSEKVNDLTEKFTNATNTITQLNSQLEELKPIKEQMELAQKEAKLTDVKTEFETKFNALGADELFKSEEIQLLLNQVAEDSIEAKLSLNEKLVEIASNKVEEVSKNPLHTIMNTVSKRDFSKVSKDNDPLSELRA